MCYSFLNDDDANAVAQAEGQRHQLCHVVCLAAGRNLGRYGDAAFCVLRDAGIVARAKSHCVIGEDGVFSRDC